MNNFYESGYKDGKKEVIDKLLRFVDNESKFIASKSMDLLLDRIVKEIKKIEKE